MKGMRQRPTRLTPVIVTCVVLLALGALLIWLSVDQLSSGRWMPQVDDAVDGASGIAWDSPAGWTVAVILVLLGLVLLIGAIVPGRHHAARLSLPVAESAAVDGSTEAVITNKSLAGLASAEASLVDGVTKVSSSADPRSVSVQITTPLREHRDIVEEVRGSVQRRLSEAGVTPVPKVRVRAVTKEMS